MLFHCIVISSLSIDIPSIDYWLYYWHYYYYRLLTLLLLSTTDFTTDIRLLCPKEDKLFSIYPGTETTICLRPTAGRYTPSADRDKSRTHQFVFLQDWVSSSIIAGLLDCHVSTTRIVQWFYSWHFLLRLACYFFLIVTVVFATSKLIAILTFTSTLFPATC